MIQVRGVNKEAAEGEAGSPVTRYRLFSTNLFVFTDFLKQDTSGMKKYISDLWKKRNYDENWQTKSADLHTKKDFKVLADKVLITSSAVINALKFDVENIVISDMWANVLKPGEGHRSHTHSNNFLSGVWYLQSDGNAGIVFCDPRPAADVIVPRKKEYTLENSSLAEYASIPNRAIIFPSWLMHYVPINRSSKNRISISWNIQLKGQLGEHHEFQSANY